MVDCSSHQLIGIPEGIPAFTTELKLSSNQLNVIPSRAFGGLRRLQKLDLADNQISKIEVDAFRGIDGLLEL